MGKYGTGDKKMQTTTGEQQKQEQPEQYLMTREEAFVMADRRDDKQIVADLSGIMANAKTIAQTFFYEFPVKGQKEPVSGLTKTGIEECCRLMGEPFDEKGNAKAIEDRFYFEEVEQDFRKDPIKEGNMLFVVKVEKYRYDERGQKIVVGSAYGTKSQSSTMQTKRGLVDDQFYFEKGFQKAARNAKEKLLPLLLKQNLLARAKYLASCQQKGFISKGELLEDLRRSIPIWSNEKFPYRYELVNSDDRKPIGMTTRELTWNQMASDEFCCIDRSGKVCKTRAILHKFAGIATAMDEMVDPNRDIIPIRGYVVLESMDKAKKIGVHEGLVGAGK